MSLPMGEIRSVHVRISGRVQGVNFRAWTERQARQLGLAGWVRNLAGGDVEAVFTGPADAVDAVLAACREGPRHARVDKIEILGPAELASGPFTILDDR
jgi:acylphosphatase